VLAGRAPDLEDDLAPRLLAQGVDVRIVEDLGRPFSPIADLRALRTLRSFLRTIRPDLVHTHTFKAGLLGRIAARGLSCATVHTYHGHWFRGYFPVMVSAVLAGVERRLAPITDVLVAVSPTVRDDLVDRFAISSRDRFHLVPGVVSIDPPSGLDREQVRRVLEVPVDAPLVGSLARLAPIKAPSRFLEVAARVRAIEPSVRFVWVGDGPGRRRFVAEILERRLEECVQWVGFQDPPAPWHAALDLEVLWSKNEGLPVALLEARSLGVPVMATDVGGVRDLIRDGEDGWLVPDWDADAAARRVLLALADKGERKRRAQNAATRDGHSYSATAHVDRLLRVYAEALRCRGERG